MDSFVIQGEQVTLPVHIRDADAHVATFAVSGDRAQQVIDYSGLEVLRPVRGRALCTLLFVRYLDGDLYRYHEFGVAFMVRPPKAALHSDLRALLGQRAGVFIHRLPVDQEFTLEAGRTIWGFPKVMSDIPIREIPHGNSAALRIDDKLVTELSVRRGVPVPGAGGAMSLDAYSHLDGVTRRVSWDLTASSTRIRPGGTTLTLGSHPWADELRSLGMPKRALFSTVLGQVQMVFGAAEAL